MHSWWAMAAYYAYRAHGDEKNMHSAVVYSPRELSNHVGHLRSRFSAFFAELDSAIAPAPRIQSPHINSNDFTLDTIHANNCPRSPATARFTHNSAELIEGLNAPFDVTGDESCILICASHEAWACNPEGPPTTNYTTI
ncbi:hypothetical protein EV363DRAFT_1413110 [Boletus edulis]|nr:hypothetical protein EV363DRAFT_1413110 [Boletus edulis]